MRLTYDPRHGVAYIRLREPSGPVETICVSDELNVDLAPDGTIYGIELLDANEQLCATTAASSWSTRRARSATWPLHPSRACDRRDSEARMNVKIVVHEAKEGGFWAEVLALPGCASQGAIMDEPLAKNW